MSDWMQLRLTRRQFVVGSRAGDRRFTVSGLRARRAPSARAGPDHGTAACRDRRAPQARRADDRASARRRGDRGGETSRGAVPGQRRRDQTRRDTHPFDVHHLHDDGPAPDRELPQSRL